MKGKVKRYVEHGVIVYRDVLGQIHNPSGYALQTPDGTKYWYEYNQIHNLNGPAMVSDTQVEYWIKNVQYSTFEEFDKERREKHGYK